MSDVRSPANSDDGEISLADLLRFLQRQWHFLGGVTVAIATVSVMLNLAKLPSYRRPITLQIQKNSPLISTLLPESTEANSVGNWATKTLPKLELDATVTSPVYDAAKHQVALSLIASEPEPLEAISASMIVDGLTQQWQEQLQPMLAEQTFLLRVQQKQAEQAVAQLEEELRQVSPSNLPRQTAMEEQRAELLREQVVFAAQLAFLTELEQELAQASRDLLPITVSFEGAVAAQTNSSVQAVIFGLMAGFMIAVLIAIAVEQWPHLRAELQATETES